MIASYNMSHIYEERYVLMELNKFPLSNLSIWRERKVMPDNDYDDFDRHRSIICVFSCLLLLASLLNQRYESSLMTIPHCTSLY